MSTQCRMPFLLADAGTAGSRPLLVHHVARRLCISCRMVRHLARTGKLRGVKRGIKIWQFRAVDVEDFRIRREERHV